MTASEYLAQNLKSFQSERHMTCTEFAAELGISKSTLYKLLLGSGRFSSATLDQISMALKVPPYILLGGEISTTKLCGSVIRVSRAVAKLGSVDREKALYYLGRFIDLLA